jgi:hypothetical protein
MEFYFRLPEMSRAQVLTEGFAFLDANRPG